MQNQVRVGVVGTSWWTDWSHLSFLKGHPQANLSAVCGRNRVRAEEVAAKHGIPQVFTDYQAMIEQANLDALVVSVPDDLHFPITMAALEAGLHVLCEKPMAFNLAQARQMLAKAEAVGVKNMIMFTWRWAPYFRALHELVSQGTIGRCYDAYFSFVSGYALGAGHHWKWDRQRGLGILGDLGSHMIDLARLTVGEIARVQASLKVRVPKPHPERSAYRPANDSASLTVQFANGATGTLFTSAAARVGDRIREQRVVLYGEYGTLEVTADWKGWSLRGLRGNETEFHDIPIPGEYLTGTHREASPVDQFTAIFSTQSIGPRLFIDSILADCPVTPGFYEGMKTQEVIEAAFKADQMGCWVDV